MDWKKFLKKLGFSENFSYSNRKVYSGFSLCFGVSLLLTVFFLNNPFKASVFPSSFGSWPFSFSTSSSSSSSSVSGDEKTHGGNFVDKGKNSSLLDSNGGTTVFEKPHGGNFSEAMNNGSFLVNTQDPKSVNGKSGGFGDMGIEGKSMGNVSGNVESVRSFSREGGIEENTKGESSSNSTFTEKSRGSADMGAEKNGARNVSGNGVGVGSVGKEGTVVSKTQNVKPVMSDGNGTFIEKPGGIVDVGTETGNVTSKGVSVRSLDREEGDLETTHDRSSFEGKKIASSSNGSQDDFTKCDIFDGRWVRDEGKPYYPGGSCPHIDRDFDCYLNGRPDDDFLKWRWQPNHCNIPSLNGTDFLERLRGKKLIFVGDSLNRNMWESLVCILRHSVPNKKKVYEISGRKEFKKKGFYAFRYEDYNCTVDFVSAPFLVSPGTFKTRNASLETLRLDLMDRTKSMYHDADIVVFNTGHWWTHEKTSKGENYYQEGNHVYPRLKVMEAYRKALTTWARWVDKNIDANKTQVFFRGYSDTHFRGGQWNSGGQCHKETEPIFNDTYLAKYPSKMKALEQVLEQMSTRVVYMNISKLTDYRKDAHPSIYRKVYKTAEEKIAGERSQDCSHWCLPGVPDTWNELLYASLLRLGRGSWQT